MKFEKNDSTDYDKLTLTLVTCVFHCQFFLKRYLQDNKSLKLTFLKRFLSFFVKKLEKCLLSFPSRNPSLTQFKLSVSIGILSWKFITSLWKDTWIHSAISVLLSTIDQQLFFSFFFRATKSQRSSCLEEKQSETLSRRGRKWKKSYRSFNFCFVRLFSLIIQQGTHFSFLLFSFSLFSMFYARMFHNKRVNSPFPFSLICCAQRARFTLKHKACNRNKNRDRTKESHRVDRS